MGDVLVFALRAEVQALVRSRPEAVWQDGIITGRTLEEKPRYDVRLTDGSIIWNLPTDYLRVREVSTARANGD